MIARQSQLFIPTLREAPADADAVSHKLLVRGGYIRQVRAGVWTFLPLGWRVHQKFVQIIREEMDAIGGQEMLMPVLTPASSGSDRGAITSPSCSVSRTGRAQFVLPMTHEETVTFHAKEISSYRLLPQILYHFSIKERDEPRPRGGLLRVREFIMKDAYSFDRDEAGLDVSFRKHEGAYHRIFQRCGLAYSGVEAESGMMGGKESLDFLAPSGSGENTLVTCENGDYAADLEVARGIPRPRVLRSARCAEEVATPGVTTIEALAEFLGIDCSATSKAMPVMTADGTLVLGLVRGDDRLSEPKMRGGARQRLPPRHGRGDPGGVRCRRRLARAGRRRGRGRRRRSLREGQFVAGANRDGWTCRVSRPGVTSSRGSLTSASPRVTRAPSAAARSASSGDRGRPHLQARHALLGPLERTYLDENGTEKQPIGWAPTASAGAHDGAASSRTRREGITGPLRSRRMTFSYSLLNLGKPDDVETTAARGVAV